MAVAREALRAHRTQVDPDGPWLSVPLDVVIAAYPYEDFEVLAARVPLPAPPASSADPRLFIELCE